jgi:hypothetical protein
MFPGPPKLAFSTISDTCSVQRNFVFRLWLKSRIAGWPSLSSEYGVVQTDPAVIYSARRRITDDPFQANRARQRPFDTQKRHLSKDSVIEQGYRFRVQESHDFRLLLPECHKKYCRDTLAHRNNDAVLKSALHSSIRRFYRARDIVTVSYRKSSVSLMLCGVSKD